MWSSSLLLALWTPLVAGMFAHRMEVEHDKIIANFTSNFTTPSVCDCRKECFPTDNCTGISVTPFEHLKRTWYMCYLSYSDSIEFEMVPSVGTKTIYRRRKLKTLTYSDDTVGAPFYLNWCQKSNTNYGSIVTQEDLDQLVTLTSSGSSDFRVWLPLKESSGTYTWWGTSDTVTASHPLWPLITQHSTSDEQCFWFMYDQATQNKEVKSHKCIDYVDYAPVLCMVTNYDN